MDDPLPVTGLDWTSILVPLNPEPWISDWNKFSFKVSWHSLNNLNVTHGTGEHWGLSGESLLLGLRHTGLLKVLNLDKKKETNLQMRLFRQCKQIASINTKRMAEFPRKIYLCF